MSGIAHRRPLKPWLLVIDFEANCSEQARARGDLCAPVLRTLAERTGEVGEVVLGRALSEETHEAAETYAFCGLLGPAATHFV